MEHIEGQQSGQRNRFTGGQVSTHHTPTSRHTHIKCIHPKLCWSVPLQSMKISDFFIIAIIFSPPLSSYCRRRRHRQHRHQRMTGDESVGEKPAFLCIQLIVQVISS